MIGMDLDHAASGGHPHPAIAGLASENLPDDPAVSLARKGYNRAKNSAVETSTSPSKRW